MVDIINSLKANARILHRQIKSGDQKALSRFTKQHGLGLLSDNISVIKRRHCLAVVAREIGFDGWSHATAVFEGKHCTDYGTILSPKRCSAHSNIWFSTYDEAKAVHDKNGGFLLAFKNQFLIVDEYFIETLGLDPKDDDWGNIDFNWVALKDVEARNRLYSKLVYKILNE